MFLGLCSVVRTWRSIHAWAYVELCPPGAMFLGTFTSVPTLRYVPGHIYKCAHLALCSWAYVELCPPGDMFLGLCTVVPT
jgi:hypothetical protein